MTALSVRTVGDGPIKVLAAHTWLADHSTYAPMIPFVDQRRFTWAFPDFRGYGGSRALTGEFSIREMAGDLLDTADRLGWDRFHLVGNSMGGQAAQLVAGGAGCDRARSLTLLCSVPSTGFPLDAETAAFFASAVGSEDVRRQLASTVTGGRLGTGFAAFVARRSMETATAAAIAGYLRAWTEEDISGEIRAFAGPMQIFVGEHDPVLTEQVARTGIASHFGDVPVGVLGGSGHYPGLEIPAFAAALASGFAAAREEASA